MTYVRTATWIEPEIFRMKKLIIGCLILLNFVSCGPEESTESSNNYMTVSYRMMEEIRHRLNALRDIEHMKSYNTSTIREELRAEINEFKICEEVLKELKDMKESMTKEAWNICEGRRGTRATFVGSIKLSPDSK